MKNIALTIIRGYQIFISPFFQALFPVAGCRSWPTCSEYTYESIKKHGAAKGTRLGFLRILKCNPWS